MRRALAWAAVCLLLTTAGALIAGHLHSDQPHSLTLAASGAALRRAERMDVPWPEGDIDLNTASIEELDRLYGVGPAIAQRIVEERERDGSFAYPEDLLSVYGIGQKTLDRLWEQIQLPKPSTNQ